MPIFANFKLIKEIPNRNVLKKHDTKIKQAQSSSVCKERPSGGPQSYGRSGISSARNVSTSEPKKETAARVPRKNFMNVDLVIFL
jgi:hypothetical protein